jgi:phosphatidylinositol-3-phosphatase
MGRVAAALGVVLAMLVTGCADSGPGAGPAASTPSVRAPSASASSGPVAGPGGPVAESRPTKLLTIVEENHGEQAALAQMPYLAALSGTYGRTSAYSAVAHPSLPNYLALVGGSTFGVTDDASPAAHPLSGPSVFDQAISAGRTAKAYIEAMPSPCALSSSGRYAVRHNPWTYFADPAERAHCQADDVPAGTPSAGPLHDDVTAGTLPTLGWVTPDLCNDAHDCPAPVADDWLRGWLPVIMGGPDFRAGRLAIVVTFDEAEGSDANTVLTTLIAPGVRHVVTATSCTHYCWTRYAGELAGTPPLRQAVSSTSLSTAFGLD